MKHLKECFIKLQAFICVLHKINFTYTMRCMNDTELIIAIGGQTAVAKAVNKKLRPGDKLITPQRVNGWKVANKIPPYFKVAYKRIFTPAG